MLNILLGGEKKMANIKSAKKRIKVIEKKTLINKSRKSALKTAEKKVLSAMASGDATAAAANFVSYEKAIRKAASASTLHKNVASRKVSRLQKRLNAMAN
jgi:small subunit ribosomal protein S20